MNHSPFALTPALAATVFVTAAALTAALAPPLWQAQERAAPPPVLGCALAPGATVGTHILITNRSTLPLPAQAAFSWSTLGTPAPRGGRQALAQDLAPGQSVALPVGAVLHASGCVAALAPAH